MRRVKVFFDGSSQGNPGPAGIGVIVLNEFGEELRRVSEPIGFKTNNEAEYHALIRALEEASRLGAEEVELFSDSELLVKQIRGEYSVKEPRLRELYARAAELISRFRKLDVLHIDRGANREADKLAREAARRAGCS